MNINNFLCFLFGVRGEFLVQHQHEEARNKTRERVVHTRIKRKSFLPVLIYIGYLLNANCVL